ncbi:bacteriohemerythrin [Acetanaerobacterium elongatum]|uniref:Hemerythrin n=1 Tax=Acetanaerobacterium elongatum TaxID=258515 RepID=A0A1H0CXG2_9FIRM|nr:bacteriohemerythrin [Acetanaerobacterium elongatum]SDN62569.1 hemerythrin [Acetanaerobacterium elongatum]
MQSWNDSLKIGVPHIDEQHKALFAAMEALYAACSAGKGRAEVIKTIDFLEDYTVKHFTEEQEIQKKSGYPKCVEHKKLHDDFIVQVKAIKKDIADNGATILSVSKLNSLLSGWLINHIKYVDTEIAQYVNK